MINSNKLDKYKKFIIPIGIAFSLMIILFMTIGGDKDALAKDNLPSGEFKVENSKSYSAALSKSAYSKISSKASNDLEKASAITKDVNSILKMKLNGYTLSVDGKEIGKFKTRKEAEEVLSELTRPYIENDEVKIESLKFKENIKVVETEIGLNQFDDVDDILYYIAKGTNETKTHKVEKGENYWVIAEKYKISSDDLIKANPKVDPAKLQIGQEISLVVPKPFITIVTTEIKEYKETIHFETTYDETDVLYKGEYKIKINGSNGERAIKAEILKENGIETGRNILEEKIIKEPDHPYTKKLLSSVLSIDKVMG